MKFLGLTQDAKDFASTEYVNQVVESEGGKINTISVDGVQQEIINKNVNIDLSGKADKTAVPEKVITSVKGEALLFNEVDGGGAKFTNVNGVESFIGVNDGTNGIVAQIYADKLVEGKWQGAKLDVSNDGMYYTVGNLSASERMVAKNEIATIGDVDDLRNSFDLVKLAEAETDYIASYKLMIGENQVGSTINIPKDFLVKDAKLKIVDVDDEPYAGAKVGDKYIDFMINVRTGTAVESKHIYLPVNDLVDVYTGDDTSIVINEDNSISIKSDYTASIKSDIETAINTEATRAQEVEGNLTTTITEVEGTLTTAITNEVSRATTRENELSVLISSEETRAKGVEEGLTIAISDEITRAENAETALQQNIDTKQNIITDLADIRSGAALGKTSIQSLAGYATESFVETQIEAERTRAIEAEGNLTTAISDEITRAESEEAELSDKIELKQDIIEDLATIRNKATTAVQPENLANVATSGDYADLVNCPTNVSAFTNDAGYLTEHQDISGKQDKLTKGYGILIDNNNKISIDDTDISTVEYVDANISDTMNFIIQERDNEHAGRVAGDELLQAAIDEKQDIIEDLSTIKSGATLGATAVQPDAISDMATKTWVGDQGYLTSHQSLSAYRTSADQDIIDAGKQPLIEDLTDIREGAALGKTSIQSLDGYATESWVEGKGYLTEHQDISGKANITYVDSEIERVEGEIPTVPTNVSAFTNDAGYLTEHQDISELATKAELEAVEDEIPSLDGYATETWVEEQEYLTEHQDISNLATKSELETVENEIPSLEGYATETWVENKHYFTTPAIPEEDGIYVLKCTVTDGAAVFNWVLEE